MPWRYKDGRIIKVGRSWKDEDGTTHPWNWVIWSDDDKEDKDLTWEEDQ